MIQGTVPPEGAGVGAFCTLLLQHHHQRTRCKQNRADQRFGCKLLVQEYERQHQRDDHAHFINRDNLGSFAQLQCLVVAQP